MHSREMQQIRGVEENKRKATSWRLACYCYGKNAMEDMIQQNNTEPLQ